MQGTYPAAACIRRGGGLGGEAPTNYGKPKIVKREKMKNRSKLRKHREINKNRKTRKANFRKKKVLLRGKISISAGGLGFVTPEIKETDSDEKVQDIFIPPQFINSAMNGDIVEVDAIFVDTIGTEKKIYLVAKKIKKL